MIQQNIVLTHIDIRTRYDSNALANQKCTFH